MERYGRCIVNEQLESYRAALAAYPEFGAEAVPIVCQSADDPVLVKLARDFNVRAHFTGASCLERALNLMHHVHTELFCPGDQVTPTSNNIYGIMAVKQQGALFCSYQAIVLTEMLLSMGVPCVRLTCTPRTFDYDRHVVTLAHMPELDRWVLLDPTFDTCFLDADGLPMAPDTIRRAYLAGGVPRFQPIAIDKQWTLVLNGVVYETYDEWYAVYMAKDLFRFTCPAESRFGDSDCHSWYVLNPNGYAERNAYDDLPQAAQVEYRESLRFAKA
jgi:hypothetical protein